MTRVIAGFLLTPIPFALVFGTVAVAVLPLMYIFELLVALPLFCAFKRWGWVRWWHAVTAGFTTAAGFVVFYLNSISPYHAEIYGPSEATVYCAIGASAGLLFWLIALYRNAAFPRRSFHWASVAAVTAASTFSAYQYLDHVRTTEVFGSVAGTPTSNEYITDLRVKLDSGELVWARVMQDTAAHLTPQRGLVLETRHSAMSSDREFWVMRCRDDVLCR